MFLEQFKQIPDSLRPDEQKFIQNEPEYLVFLDQVKEDIATINTLIESYNLKKSFENLKLIHDFYLSMSHKYRGDYLTKCRIHSQQVNRFYDELQTVSKLFFLNGKSIFSIDSEKTEKQNILELGDIIANLSEESCVELLEFLNRPEKINLSNPVFSDKLREISQYLHVHHISFLGGKYSKHFLLTPAEGESFVLSAFDLMSNPYSGAKKIEEIVSLKNAINRPYFQRMTQNILKQYHSIKIGPYCPQKDLRSIAKNIHEKPFDVSSIVSKTLLYFTQMCLILEELKEHQLAFPDMKIDNWSVDQDGRVQILDLKSILFTDSQNQVSRTENRLRGYSSKDFLFTQQFISEEMLNYLNYSIDNFSAEKMHTHLLGLNLKCFFYGSENTHWRILQTSTLKTVKILVGLVEQLTSYSEAYPNIQEIFYLLNQYLLEDIDEKIREIATQVELPDLISHLRQGIQTFIGLNDVTTLNRIYCLCEDFRSNIALLSEIKACSFYQPNTAFKGWFLSFRDKLKCCNDIESHFEIRDEIQSIHEILQEIQKALTHIKETYGYEDKYPLIAHYHQRLQSVSNLEELNAVYQEISELDEVFKESITIMRLVNTYSFGEKDVMMKAYSIEIEKRFIDASDIVIMKNIVSDIKKLAKEFEASNFNDIRKGFFKMKLTSSQTKQVAAVEETLCKIPLNERKQHISHSLFKEIEHLLKPYQENINQNLFSKPSSNSEIELPLSEKGHKS